MRANSALFLDEALAECQPLARLLYIGMLLQADDWGRLPNRPKFLKAIILPYDNVDIDVLIDELYKANLITDRMDESSQIVIVINNYEEYGK